MSPYDNDALTRLPKYISSNMDYPTIKRNRFTVENSEMTTSGLNHERNIYDSYNAFGIDRSSNVREVKYQPGLYSTQNIYTPYTPSSLKTGSFFYDESKSHDYSGRESLNSQKLKIISPSVSYWNYLVDIILGW